MKKLFTVLAVLLVASLAFAGFSGNVKAKYTFDFDKKTIGYGGPDTSGMDVTFEWDSQELVIGSAADTHVELKVLAGLEGWYGFNGNHADGYQPWLKYDANLKNVRSNSEDETVENSWYKSPEAGTLYFPLIDGDDGSFGGFVALLKLKVDTFKIVGKNFEVDFLGSVGLDFAKSAVDTKKFNKGTLEENVQNFSLNNSVKGKHNLAVTVYGYKFGFGLKTSNDYDYRVATKTTWSDNFNVALTGVTPEYAFGDVKVQAGLGYQVFDNDWTLAGSAKVAYENDKMAVSGAYDFKKDGGVDLIKNDLAVAFSFAPVAVDVYYNNEGGKAKDKYFDYFNYGFEVDPETGEYVLDDDDNRIPLFTTTAKHEVKLPANYLSAKVVFDVAKIAENVPVVVTVTGQNLINKEEQVLSAKVTTTAVKGFEFGVYFNNWFDFDDAALNAYPSVDHRKLGATVKFTGVENLTLDAEIAYAFARNDGDKKFFALVGAEYVHSLFTASAQVACEKVYEEDAKFGAIFGAKSTTLVEGAEIGAKAWFNLNDLADTLDDSNNATNKIELSCKVSF